MPVAPGTKLGPYEIVAPIGSGGMGEVYRARDCNLKREVALKVLPENFASDAMRMARFEREAQLLASLNHPHIAHIYGVEEAHGIRALVMELVEGPTLAERIAQGRIPLEEAIPLAKQIAEGLEFAHEKGIVHRDLKPANVKVTPDGQVKILDFGLAKAIQGDGSEGDISTSPTISLAATRAGVLLGTAGYMSPEQAKGKVVDRRADIWAYGCVLFEMLAGKSAFEGETITDKLAAVVRAEPDLTQLPENTQLQIRELLQRCLVKDPKQRLQAIGEARIALEKWMARPEEESATPVMAVAARRHWEWILGTLAVASTVGVLLIGFLHWGRAPEAKRVLRTYVKAMPNSSLLFSIPRSGFALSPDGLRLAYVAQSADGKVMLWVRPLDSLQAQFLDGTQDATFPFWSPDSRSIGFFADGKLKKIKAVGGPPLTLCDAPSPRGGTWNQDGVILFAPDLNVPLHRVSASGGAATPVTSTDSLKGDTTNRWPQFLPDGRHFLYLGGTPFGLKENPTNSVLLGSLDSKESKFLMHSHSDAVFASGHILFLRQNTLMAQPFDTKRLELTGDAFPVADPVQEEDTILRSLISVSNNGLLAYLEGATSMGRELIWLDRSGKKVGEVPEPGAYNVPRISRDGKKLTFTAESPGYDIWSYNIASGVKTRLTFGTASGQAYMIAIWSPDGQRIAYISVRSGKFGVHQRPADGSGSEEVLVEDSDKVMFVNDWSPDGKFLSYQAAPQGINQIWILPLSGERKPYQFLQSQFPTTVSSFSPNGKWLAYCTTEPGGQKVYVVPFPGPGGKWQVSPGGGCYPRWRRDGKELFYISPDNKMMAAEINENGPSFGIGAVHPLFETQLYRRIFGTYDVTPDGQQFIVPYQAGLPNAAITLVENWDAELKKK